MKLLYTFCFSILTTLSYAQTLHGVVTDENNTPLPYTTVYVPQLKKGTASNEDGIYELKLPRGKYRLVFQYLGYRSQEKDITMDGGDNRLDIQLVTEPVQLQNVIVTDDREDPAYTIMRKAIAKAKYHTQQIDSFRTTVYIKGSGRLKGLPWLFRKKLEKELAKEGIDTATAFTTESVSELTYKRPNQYDERVISVHSVGEDNNTSPAGFINGSFYEPEMNGAVSPLSPRAFAYYRFEYLGEYADRGHLINKIKVTPRSRGDNVFEGTIYIVDQLWSIHSLDLNTYIWGILFNINQVYAPIEENAWLPINNIFNVSGQFFGFKFEYKYFANMSDYVIALNPDLEFEFDVIDDKIEPEVAKSAEKALEGATEISTLQTLGSGEEVSRKQLRKLLKEYEKQEQKDWGQDTLQDVIEVTSQQIDTLAYKRDSFYWEQIRPIPLTQYEVKGYRVLDSIAREEQKEEDLAQDSVTVTIGSQSGASVSSRSKSDFQPKDLLLGANYKLGEKVRFGIDSPLNTIHFNTVDGYNAAYSVRLYSRAYPRWSIAPTVRYAFSRKHLNYALRNSYSGGPRGKRWAVILEGGHYPVQLNPDEPIHPMVNTFMSLLFERNYLRLYEKDFVQVGFQKDFTDRVKVSLEAEWSNNKMLRNHSDFKVFNSDKRVYTSNIPYNAQIGDTAFPRYNATKLRLGITARPWLKYRIRNGRKSIIGNSSPTLSMMVRSGLNNALESDIEFSHIEVGFKHDIPFAGGGVMNLKSIAGTFVGNNNMYFPDFKHFLGNQLPFATTDPVGSFRLLEYYRFSTQSSYATAHVHYQFRKLLATHLLEVRLAGIKENFFVNVLETKGSNHYAEVGYGLNYILRVFRLEFVTSWEDFKYRDWGVRIGIATNLDNLFD